MKYQDVTRVHMAANPLISYDCSIRYLRNMQIFPFVVLKTEAVRAFQNSQWPYVNGAVVQRYPHGEELRISAHELVVLMRMDHKTLTVGKDEASNRLWMNQYLFTNEHLHHLSQGRLMRQRVK